MPGSHISVARAGNPDLNVHIRQQPTHGDCGEHRFTPDAGKGRVQNLAKLWQKPVSPENTWSSQPGGPARALSVDERSEPLTPTSTDLDSSYPEEANPFGNDEESNDTDIGKFVHESASNSIFDDKKPAPLPRVKSLPRQRNGQFVASRRANISTSTPASTPASTSPPGTSRSSMQSLSTRNRAETPPVDPDQYSMIDKTGIGQAGYEASQYAQIDDAARIDLNPGYASIGRAAASIAEQRVHDAVANSHPRRGLFATATEPRVAESHPDVAAARTLLETALRNAAPKETRSARKAAQPTGSTILRRLMMFTRRRHNQPLPAHSMAFYKHLVWHSEGASSRKQVSASLAALAQRAAAEGYEAVDLQFVKETLNPQLHSLPPETLAYLARLKNQDNKARNEILSKVDKLLGVKKGRQTGKAEQACKQAQVAAALLDLVAELCHEHFRIKTWDRPMASFLSAVDQRQYDQLDEALREIWSGDLQMGDMERARESRLYVRRLGEDQLHKLASALGLAGPTDESAIFEEFEQEHLSKYERDKAIRDQVIKLLTHLRVEARNALRGDRNTQHLSTTAFATIQDDFQAASYPAAREPTMMRRIASGIRKSFRRAPAAQITVERQIKQAALAFAQGGQPTEELLKALTSTYANLDKALGKAGASALVARLAQDRVKKMQESQLTQLELHLEEALGALPDKDAFESLSPSRQEDAKARRRFYDDLRNAQRKEPGVRSGSEALKQVLDALPDTRHPERLRDALDSMAAASCRILDGQDELDFYKSAFLRLDGKKRKALSGYLNGRHGIDRHVQAVGKVMVIAPKAWSDFRLHQLNMLARAAAATA